MVEPAREQHSPRVREIFEAARPMPLEDRRAYVSAVCGADRALAASVDQLLASLEGAGEPAETQVLASDHAAAGRMEGRRIGPYDVTERIGVGGMGEVYMARDTRLGRTVAVKVLPPTLTHDPQRRARFEREARAVAALNHPHICTLHDIGRCDGIDFLVMEYVQGVTLHGPDACHRRPEAGHADGVRTCGRAPTGSRAP